MDNLIAKLEGAAEGSRELDAMIAVACKIGARGLLPDDHEYLSLPNKRDGVAPGHYWFHCRSGMSLRSAELYSTSLDAAMTLVPEGQGLLIDIFDDGQAAVMIRAQEVWHYGNSAALALCIAALKARAQQEMKS